jgi:NAD+ synthetase
MTSLSHLPIALAQCDMIVGDIAGNSAKIADIYSTQARAGAALVVFPECAITGYPAEDILLYPHFQEAAMHAVEALAAITRTHNAAMIVGGVWREDDQLYNAAFWLEDGAIQQIFRKISLPNEGVFDERRHFAASVASDVMEWRGLRISVIICEDMWHPRRMSYHSLKDIDVCIIINASPFEEGKLQRRHQVAQTLSRIYPHPLIYVNMVGGQDEIVFDGGSFCLDANGNITHQLPCFVEDVRIIQLGTPDITPAPDRLESLYAALCMGLRAYIHKNGFTRVLLGLSGGVDSALVAAIAADALGAEHVHCVMLPSRYNAAISMEDALIVVERLGVRHSILPIEAGREVVSQMLSPLEGVPSALAAENIQSRLRGMLLMAISNSSGEILLTTGNKSEVAVGYCTLYGDMCGAFNVLKDIYKTDVYALAVWRNTQGEQDIIPPRILQRAPSAELREGQQDSDSLPPYDVLDAILHHLIEGRASVQEVVDAGFDEAIVQHVAHLLRSSEYKRRQAPVGVKVSSLAFGRDWRMPLTSKMKG